MSASPPRHPVSFPDPVLGDNVTFLDTEELKDFKEKLFQSYVLLGDPEALRLNSERAAIQESVVATAMQLLENRMKDLQVSRDLRINSYPILRYEEETQTYKRSLWTKFKEKFL